MVYSLASLTIIPCARAEAMPYSSAVFGIVLINLDRSADRRDRMRQQFASAGLPFARFSAVDGVALTPAVCSFFCNDAGQLASPLRVGEIGCYASHLRIWQDIVASKYPPVVLVCEDDILLPLDLCAVIEGILRAAPTGWDIVRLAYRNTRAFRTIAPVDRCYDVVRFSRQPMRSGAYLISQAGAGKLLRPGLRDHPIDLDLARPWAFDLEALGVFPPPIKQLSDRSLIQEMGGRLFAGRRPGPAARFVQVFSTDKIRRFTYAFRTLGLREWLLCLAENAWRKLTGAHKSALENERSSPQCP